MSLYALVAYTRTREHSIEAAVKYLVLAAVSAAFLLFGMALVYAELGTMDFVRMATSCRPGAPDRVVALVGVGLIVVGFRLQVGARAVPSLDAGCVSGRAGSGHGVRRNRLEGRDVCLAAALFHHHRRAQPPCARSSIFAILAIASMVVGNLLALLQSNVKRLLAYSSIAHLGYLARGVPGERSPRGHSDHLLPGGVLRHDDRRLRRRHGAVDRRQRGGESGRLPGPVRATSMAERGLSAMLLSLAGIPLTAGFVGKFYLTVAAGGAALWSLLIVMMVTSGIGLFYYLRIIVAMFMESAAGASAGREPSRLPFIAGLTLSALTVALVWLGVYPAPLIRLIRVAVTGGG